MCVLVMCVSLIMTHTKTRVCGREIDEWQNRYCPHQHNRSWLHPQSYTHVALNSGYVHTLLCHHIQSLLCFMASVRVMELCSRWIWGVNENLISSSKPLQFRRTEGREGVLDLINLFPYWIGSLPGTGQLCPIMHLNDTGSYRVACEII